MKNKKKSQIVRTVLMGVLLLSMFLPIYAAKPSVGLPYLHLQDAITSDVYQFNEKGAIVDLTDPPQALVRGWLVLTGFDPVVIRNKNVTILLQQESILSVVSDKIDNLHFYLVAGSASFLRDETYVSTMNVDTPIGSYEVMGPGEIFVSSDVSELIFSLGSSVKVTNSITRKRATLSPYHYLDLADPFLKEKPISKQTYSTLSINPEVNRSSLLPSSSVTDGLKIATITSVNEKAAAVAKETKTQVTQVVAATPVVKEPVVKEPVVKEPVVKEPVVKEPVVTEPAMKEVVVPDEVFNVYIIHTNDAYGTIADSAIDYPTLATLLSWNESVHPRTLLVDAGNSLSGSELANMNKGFDAATLYQTLGYDAISPSTAEFAFGIDHLVEATKIAKQNNYLDILASNVNDSSGALLFTPYKIYDLDGYRVGVIGLSFPQENTENLSFYPENYISLGQQLINEVKKQADYVVVLGNITPSSPFTAEQMVSAVSGIDLFIDGKYGNGRETVGSTLIVQAGEKLTSVGVVELTIRNDELDNVTSFAITKDDVASPQTSALAQNFNITSIPQDENVAAFISSLEKQLAMSKKGPVVPPPVAEIEVEAVAKVVEPEVTPKEEVVEPAVVVEEEVSPLVIQPQKGITTSAAVPASTNKFGVKTSFIATKDDVLGNNAVKVGFSINPYIQIKKARLGLQAFYLTDTSIFTPFNAPINNLNFGSDVLGNIRSSMRFIDYFYYGEEDDTVFIQMDDTTPITFGKGFLINNYMPNKGPANNDNLALYSSVQIGLFGVQTFFDDMYLTNFSSSNKQNGALRFSFDIGQRVELGVGSLINTNKTFDDVTLYPTIDASWLVSNKRTFQLSLFTGVSTSLDILPFSITPLYDSTGSTFGDKFPNFQAAAGMEINTEKWNISLIAAAINAADPLMQYRSMNDSYYSGSRISQDTGIQFLAGITSSYTSDRFGFDASYYVPFEQDFSDIVPLDAYPSVTGDNLNISISYMGSHFSAQAGLRKFGVISSMKELFSFDDGLSGFLDDAYAFIGKAGTSDPYISGSYTSGPFSVYADLSFTQGGTSNLTVGSTVDISNRGTKSVARKEKKDEGYTYSFDVDASYTRLFPSGPDSNYLLLSPVLTIAKDNVSFGLGPKLSFNADTADLYTHSFNSPFTYSSGVSGTFASTFDIATDVLSLVNHFEVANSANTNYLRINRTQSYSSGPLIRLMDTTSDSDLQDKLSLVANIDTKVFDMNLFVNDLTSLQLSQLRIGIAPFKNYGAEFALSGIASTILDASEKQFDIITTLDGTLPVINKEHSKVALYGGFSTLLGYNTTDGFKQMLYNSSVPQFLARFNNYVISAGINSTFNNFTLNLMASTQEGSTSLGMYNSFFTREREDIIGGPNGFNAQWSDSTTSSGRTYSASIDTSYKGESFDLHASYILPLTSSFALLEEDDLIHLGLEFDVKNFSVGLEYSRRGFMKATKDFINSTSSFIDKTKTFLINEESLVGLTLGVTSGNLDLHAKIGTYTSLINDGSYNGVNKVDTTPILTLGANINLF